MEDATISPIRDQGKYGGAIEEQRISTQVWRIPRKRININVLKERVEENVGVYGKEDCSIPTLQSMELLIFLPIASQNSPNTMAECTKFSLSIKSSSNKFLC